MKRKKYMMLWRNKFLTVEAKSFKEMVEALEASARFLRSLMESKQVFLETPGGTADDYAMLYTYNKKVAKRFGFQEAEC